MFALSTAWNTEGAKDGRTIAEEITRLGINKIELNFSLTKTMVEDIFQFAQKHKTEIISLHNFCPIPQEISRKKALPDYFSLASTDEEERKKAVLYTKNTIATAKKVSAKAVVLHCGRVEIEDKTRRLINLYNAGQKNSPLYREVLESFLKEREEKHAPHLEQILKSLETLAEVAQKQGVTLGIENRFYYREIPCFEEFGIIFERLINKPVVFWLDVGHNFIFEKLGFFKEGTLLKTYGTRLFGVHLHNIKNLVDHQAPIDGEFDFKTLKPYIRPETIKVLEVHQQATAQQIKKSIKYLSGVFS
jgi:sugar phosphate isomerase/epimerase